MYSSERIQAASISESKFFEAGIHEGIKLVSYRLDTAPSGNKFLEFTFSDGTRQLRYTEWEQKINTAYEATEEERQRMLQNRESTQGARIFQLLKCYYTEELTVAASSFWEFAQWVIMKLDMANKDTTLRVKMVYDDKGYLTLPRYAKATFIEPDSVPKENSKISILKIDKMERPVLADKEVSNPNPLAVGSQVGDDLPF